MVTTRDNTMRIEVLYDKRLAVKKPSRHEGKKAYREAALGPKRKKGMGEYEWFLFKDANEAR